MASIFETLVGKEEVSGGQQFFNLASNGSKKGEKINSKTSTISKKEARIPKDELEFAYTADSFNFNAVNVAVQMIMSGGYKITAKKANVRKFFEVFLENLSKVGADTTWDEILSRIYQDNYIYGGGWNELVWNRADTKIVDYKTLDPKEMDFARNSNGNILLDENEKPIGYTQKVPFGIDTKGLGDEQPKGITLSGNQIFILAKRISYIPLYTFGPGFEGIGKLEPGYRATIWKLNLLKAGAESASRRGYSPIIAKVGNENVHPTPQMTADVLKSIQTLDYAKYMAIPWYVELTTLDVKSIETYGDFLKYLTAMQSASLGVPVPFVTGLGEETNRATLGTQLLVFELSLNTIAYRICRCIEKNMFKPISDAEGFDEVPKIEWGVISAQPERFEKKEKQEDKKKEKKEKDPDEEEEEDVDKKMECDSTTNRGSPMNTSHQTQGISIDKRNKVKIKSPKKRKV